MVAIALPDVATNSMPPLFSTVPLAVPPWKTPATPPNLTSVALAVNPPLDTIVPVAVPLR